MLIRNLSSLDGTRFDMRFEQRIQAIAPTLEPQTNESWFDAAGRLALPGLHDHHCHFLAYAASLASVDCAGAAHEQQAALLDHLHAALPKHSGGLRAIGYHEGSESLLDRHILNRVSAEVPIRVQHRTGRLWIYNDAAIAQLEQRPPDSAERDDRGELTGRFFHMDDWLREHFPKPLPDVAHASQRLAAYGITGLTDAGPDNDNGTAALFQDLQEEGRLSQRITLMGCADLQFTSTDFLRQGPCKIYLKESALPDLEGLCELIAQQHQRQRAVAFHCVTAAELHFALAALTDVGALPTDRIEHASLCDDDALAIIKDLGISVVSQPIFIAERGDRYRASFSDDDQQLLYRARSFLDAGIPFAASSDAPFGNANPWQCMRAATYRKTPSGITLNAAESLTPDMALQMYLGEPSDPGRCQRQLGPGEAADFVVLSQRSFGLDTLPEVFQTYIDGHCVFTSDNDSVI
ncbi:amidohydrolase family protein [Litorivivens sp.]|uniref:amidohydrolase family protein n=1 Tax=Litorivivens sp. TaxID=2020868 RepID=UPI00356B2E42